MTTSSSSSSSSFVSSARWIYDVFLSFRGEDTRKTFTSHLYEGLRSRGIFTFQDDKLLDTSSSIPIELFKAIEESQVAVIIFSKNYASSRWCLDELVKIMRCKDEYGQTVIPVFYDVDPSEVRNQRASFAEAFAKHGTKCTKDNDVAGMEKVQRWRTALTLATNLKGYDIRGRIESEIIQQIVDQISSKLCKTPLSSLQDVVGLNTHLENVKSLLEIGINNVRFVGIWGMGGVGKTTVARAIFDTLSYQFEAACFLPDVKENEKRHQMHSLQNTLLSELLRKKSDYVSNKDEGMRMIMSRLRFMKILIVLDDIDHKDHLDYLAGDPGWFGNGSRVVVTTRDSHLIGKDDVIYEVTVLPDREAIQLFNQHAFKNKVPDEHFEKLSWEVVHHAKGLPLALKVWGSFLHKRGIAEWTSAIKQMKKHSNSEIVEKLKISYDGLEAIQQEMFLDIACFFRGYGRDEVKEILETCDFEVNIGLSVLIEKSLVFITGEDMIEMHDLIQEMGTYIVKLQKDLAERSRLWLAEDFKEVVTNNPGTKAVEAIWIKDPPLLYLSHIALENMNMLRILFLPYSRKNIFHCSIEYLSSNLRWLVWHYYPWKSLPTNFEPKRLVYMELRRSLLSQLWMETKYCRYLRKVDLRNSTRLIQTPDFIGMPNLEILNLHGCANLKEVHHSLGYCRKLITLDLYGCICLKSFSSVNVESLEYLCLFACLSLEKFPEIIGRMKLELKIDMEHCYGIRELSSSIQYQTHITKLVLSDLKGLAFLPSSIGKLKSLVILDVSGCSELESLPEEIGDLENLEKLDAKHTRISQPPSSITCLNKLKFLDFTKAKSEEGLSAAAVHFGFPQVNEGLCSLEFLSLNYCNLIDGGLPEDIGCLSSLKELHLRGNNFDHLPKSIAHLCALQFLDLDVCEKLKELPPLPPNIDTLLADYHVALKSIQNLATKYNKLQLVEFTVEDDATHWVFNDLFAQTLLRFIFSLQHASNSLSQRVFTIVHPGTEIPVWLNGRTPRTTFSYKMELLLNLPDNWYVGENFLGFAICYLSYCFTTVKLKLFHCRDMSGNLSKKFQVKWHSNLERVICFMFIPFASLWDISKANGKTPNYYDSIKLSSPMEMDKLGFRLLYKDDPDLEALSQMGENDDMTIGNTLTH